MMYYDSTGKPIVERDKVRWRGQPYIIKSFHKGEGRSGIARIEFTTMPHTDEVPDEFSVDILPLEPIPHKRL